MIHIKPSRFAIAALALTLVPGAAFAEDAGASGTTQMNALDFDCARLVAMDTELVPGVLYFISGYSQGQRDAGMPDAASTGADASDTSADAAETGDNADSTADATTTADSDASDAETPDSAGAAASDAGDTTGTTAEISAIAGHFEIPVENLIVACEADPTRMVSDVIDEERARSGGELSDGPEGTAPDRNDESSSADDAANDQDSSGSDLGASQENDSDSAN